jgi:hypothetical protein
VKEINKEKDVHLFWNNIIGLYETSDGAFGLFKNLKRIKIIYNIKKVDTLILPKKESMYVHFKGSKDSYHRCYVEAAKKMGAKNVYTVNVGYDSKETYEYDFCDILQRLFYILGGKKEITSKSNCNILVFDRGDFYVVISPGVITGDSIEMSNKHRGFDF